tara:strand:+ start:1221 stop:1907 length:687 start_codon:yes stop_codon:yes gene_type:complete
MEFIEIFENSTNQYSKKIKDSKYTEGRQEIKKKGVDDICEIIIGNNEIEYSSCENSQKSSLILKKKLEIASNIVPKENHTKKFSVSLIQNGFQSKNVFSSILYLNEYYKIHCIIYNEDTNQYYRTSLKNYDPLYCVYKNDSWFIMNEVTVDTKHFSNDMNGLDTILTMDMKDIYIYKPYLMPITKYKLKDLEEIAKDEDISLNGTTGKKKLKKQLYDDINLKHYTQDI